MLLQLKEVGYEIWLQLQLVGDLKICCAFTMYECHFTSLTGPPKKLLTAKYETIQERAKVS